MQPFCKSRKSGRVLRNTSTVKMANNYFGFTHGGTQYSAQPAAYAPAPAQATYVQQAPQYAATPVARTQPYDSYQTAAPTAGAQYTYTARSQAPVYETGKAAYYSPAAAPPGAGPATGVYAVSEAPYQAAYPSLAAPAAVPVVAKPAYASTQYAPQQPSRQSTTVKVQPTSYSNFSSTSTPSNSTPASQSYDAAVYSAATSYYQQQQQGTKGPGGVLKKPFMKKPMRLPPKQPQLHYCEICKISCAGPQTYREHLEGQKHKKKEIAMKATGSVTSSVGSRLTQNQLRCELCDVTCTGSDAYAAHIRGAKHQKVVKLHTKLGKPIPPSEPTVVGQSTSTATKPVSSTTTSAQSKPVMKTATSSVPVKKVLAPPKINFVGAGTLKSTERIEKAETKTEAKEPTLVTTPEPEDTQLLPGEKEVSPVGHEYIEELKNEFGKVVSFHCKLCECKFNDPNAKLMHMKGRRHRLQFKKKVDPSLAVDIKPSMRMRKVQEEKMRRQQAKEDFLRRRDAEERWRMEMRYMMSYEQPSYGYGGYANTGGPVKRPDSIDDKHIMAKHATIYPSEQELKAVQNVVSACEKSLKQVSDIIADTKEPVEEGESVDKDSDKDNSQSRVLKGVMRVGVLAKGLLLHGDLNVHLVVLCAEKPTRTLLELVADNLPTKLQENSDVKYSVKICVEEAAIIVSSEVEPMTYCTITLTSPVMRDENLPKVPENERNKPDPPDVLDRQKCLDALAALRHAKWFQARASGLQSCVIVIRILRDLCQRVPTWTPLNQWAMELLVEKCVSSSGPNMTPGDALRRVFECISSGMLLPGSPGLYDPCEKDPIDATAGLSNQEREDITASAQHALRLIAFKQIHKVLGMDPLPVNKPAGKNTNPRKRKATSSSDANEMDGEGKKDKKDE